MFGYLVANCGIDFGYRYTPSAWRKGIGFEVAKLILKFGIKDLKFQKIYALSHIKKLWLHPYFRKIKFQKEE